MVTSSDWRRDRALVDEGATTQMASGRVSQEERFTGEIQFLVQVGFVAVCLLGYSSSRTGRGLGSLDCLQVSINR
jgi:hypothetical protein